MLYKDFNSVKYFIRYFIRFPMMIPSRIFKNLVSLKAGLDDFFLKGYQIN